MTLPFMRLGGTIFTALWVQKVMALSPPFHLSASSKTFPLGLSSQHKKTHLFSSRATGATPLPPAIKVDGLTCSHDGGSTYQLNDVSYVLPRGGRIGLVGRNGCGVSFIS
jgi:ABC-type transport system involved in cytochrome bd biosynthesis fused ATPase/permease subunit